MCVIVTEIQCPSCFENKNSLPFWRKLGDVSLFICNECKTKELSNDDLLRIGFLAGFQNAKTAITEANRKVVFPTKLSN